MRFLNFLRRMNRGIALALLLIIGLSCYLTVDGFAFEKERESIRQVLEEYTAEMGMLFLLPEQYRAIETSIPDTAIEAKLKDNEELLNKYFAIGNNHHGWNMKRMVSEALAEILQNNQKSGNRVKACDTRLTRVNSVTKHGTDLVTVDATIMINLTATAGADFLQIFYNGGDYYYTPAEMPDQSVGDPVPLTFSTQSMEVTFSCEMVKRDGRWKFSNTDSMSIQKG